MNSRERMLRAIRHQAPDRVPFTYSGEKEVDERLLKYFKKSSLDEVLKELHIDAFGVVSNNIWPESRKCPDGSTEDKWGVRRRKVAYSGGSYTEIVYSPLSEASSIKNIEDYNWHDPKKIDFSGVSPTTEKYRNETLTIEWGLIGTFGIAWSIRGMENLMMDMSLNPGMVEALVEKVDQIQLEVAHRYYEKFWGIVDIIACGDDYGMQTGLLISREMFRKYFLPSLKMHFDLAKEHNCIAYLHSCGSIREIIPDLIEIGIDVLNPIQVRAKGMDPKELKREFGKDLCFHGGVDIQQTLPHGSPKDVRNEVKERIKTLSPGGGFILGPTHYIQADTPIENIMALYEAAYKYGKY